MPLKITKENNKIPPEEMRGLTHYPLRSPNGDLGKTRKAGSMKDKKVSSTALSGSPDHGRMLNDLKVSEMRFRRLFETAQDGILILDAKNGKINEVNPFLINMLGYSREEFLGKKLWEIGPFKDVKASKAEFSKLQRKKYVRYEDLPLQARDGRKIEVEFVSNIYMVDKGKVIQCNIRDITDRKKAENDLAEMMNQQLKDETADRKERDRFISANNLLVKMLGKSLLPQEYIDTLVTLLQDWSGCACLGVRIANEGTKLHYDSHQGFRLAYWVSQGELHIEECKDPADDRFEMTKGGSFYLDSTKKNGAKNEVSLPMELKKKFQDIGIKKPYVLVIIPVFYNKKTIALIYLADKRIGKDTSAEIKFIEQLTPLIGESIYKFNLEEKMRATQRELTQARRLSDIGTLSATVAHELRNPLAAINLAVHNIRRKKRQDTAIEPHLDSINKKILESDRIIDNLLFYSRLKTPHYEAVNIYSVLNECIDSAKKRYDAQNVSVIKKLMSVKNLIIQADPFQMKELFVNILNNAFDAVSGKKSAITIGARLINHKSIELCFHDNGVGVNSADISSVFEPFFTTKAKGTGLGLTVCHQIVTLHQGSIAIKSPKNKGTTVTIILPKDK